MSGAEFVRYALGKTAEEAESRGMPRVELRGQLIRPSLAYEAAVCESDALSREFWSGALAIQYAHEASLIHDDIVDEASTRRGEPTVAQARGVGSALVIGDHLLTASYRLAAATGSIDFVSLFAQCVERTVAGEIAQARSLGRVLTFDEYKVIAELKSGELLAASLSLGAALSNPSRIAARLELGRQLGLLYQMLDDLLDYCPATDTGKPALGDFRQKRWTWPLLETGDLTFDDPCTDVARSLREGGFARCLERIEREAKALSERLTAEFAGDVGQSLIDEWLTRARDAVAREQLESVPSVALRSGLPAEEDVIEYLARNSKSFRFASRFFPQRELSSVARVYAFCRITDDIVDKTAGAEAGALLGEWMHLARSAYDGRATGIRFLDQAMEEMRSRAIPFVYAEELAEGMRMDLRGQRYGSVAELRTYTYRVASVVGLWLTELAGVRDRSTLKHAEALGHAMQLTNILRDVGEDARQGRIYLPLNRLKTYGITAASIAAAARGDAPPPSRFPDLVEELLRLAERDYAFALTGVRDLPTSFQRPVAVAAHVYRGIHGEIRRNGYDCLTRRAVTSTRSKAMFAARAIWELQTTTSAGALRSA
ncbi:MAG TPA: squalene/phytoene synthase family protein [Gemmatimonadaceae bacterium]